MGSLLTIGLIYATAAVAGKANGKPKNDRLVTYIGRKPTPEYMPAVLAGSEIERAGTRAAG